MYNNIFVYFFIFISKLIFHCRQNTGDSFLLLALLLEFELECEPLDVKGRAADVGVSGNCRS